MVPYPQTHTGPQHNKIGDQIPVRQALYAAAINAAIGAWRTGENIQSVLTAAGYAQYVIDAATEYIRRTGPAELEAYSQSSQPSSQPTMSSSAPKRWKGGVATTTTYTKKKLPVAPSVKKYVKKCMDRLIEDKYKTTDIQYTNVPTAGSIQADMLALSQGITDATRIGNNIRVRHFSIRGTISSSTPDIVRVILFWDRQSNGATPAVTDVLVSAGFNQQYNPDTVVGHGGGRFEIISDRAFICQPSVVTERAYRVWTHKWYGNKVIHYDGTTGLIGDIVSNNLGVLYISEGATGDVVANLRVKFQDA